MPKTVHFRVDAEFVCDRARQLWAEMECKKAYEILEAVHGLTQDLIQQILEGKKKLVGVEEIKLVDDNTTEVLGMPLLSLKEMLEKQHQEIENAKSKEVDLIAMMNPDMCVKMASPWGRRLVPLHVTKLNGAINKPDYELTISWEEYARRFPCLAEEEAELDTDEIAEEIDRRLSNRMSPVQQVLDADPHDPNEDIEDRVRRLNQAWITQQGLNPAVNNMLEAMNEEVKPVFGSYKDRCGWLLPNGKFYKCKYFQHDKVLNALGKDTQDVEGKWVRVQHTADKPMPFNDSPFFLYTIRKLTKKQINFMWDYCQYHNLPYPDKDIEEIQ